MLFRSAPLPARACEHDRTAITRGMEEANAAEPKATTITPAFLAAHITLLLLQNRIPIHYSQSINLLRFHSLSNVFCRSKSKGRIQKQKVDTITCLTCQHHHQKQQLGHRSRWKISLMKLYPLWKNFRPNQGWNSTSSIVVSTTWCLFTHSN